MFANYGGRETALSYGVEIDFSDLDGVCGRRRGAAVAVPEAHRDFLQGLKFSLALGDFFFCHAGIVPACRSISRSPRT